MVHEGQRLKDGDAVFELVVEDPIRLWVNVPERFRSGILEGQTVRVSAQALPGVAFEGKVDRINPSVDPASRTFQVEALIPNPDGRLRPGGFAKGIVVTRRDEQAVVVPIESVYRYAGVTRVFLVEPTGDGRQVARGVSVETGRQLEGGLVEVLPLEGQPALPTSGQVITTGLTRLSDGAVLQVRDPRKEAEQQAAEDAARIEAAAPPTAEPAH
jgi:RND family efflux transporter MFP subunit